jgi:hypothetical protein
MILAYLTVLVPYLTGAAGTAIPMLSKDLGFDVLGVTIFLSLATALLHWLA